MSGVCEGRREVGVVGCLKLKGWWVVLRGQNGQGMGDLKPAKLSQFPFLALLN